MKFLLFFIVVILFTSCEESQTEIKYRKNHGVYVPDSLRPQYVKFIEATVSAASLHMTGGDYEDPEDLVSQVERTANHIYGQPCETLEYTYSTYWTEIGPKEKLNEQQLKIFNSIK